MKFTDLLSPRFTLVLPLALAASACGIMSRSGSGGGGDEPAPAPAPTVKAPLADEVYLFDETSLPTQGSELEYKGKPVTWSVRLTVDSEVRTTKTNVEFNVVRQELANQAFKGSSQIALEITLKGMDEANATKVLATNLKGEADATPVTSALWQQSCPSVTPRINIIESATVTEKEGKKKLKVAIKLCDFAQVLVAPTLAVVPAQTKEDPRLVVWECAAANSPDSSTNVLYAYNPGESTCRAGYTLAVTGSTLSSEPLKNPDGSLKSIHLPKGMVNEPFRINTGYAFIDSLPASSVDKRYKLVEKIFSQTGSNPLPIGKMSDCHSIEVEMLYKDAASASTGTSKAARLTFRRNYDSASGSLIWVGDDQTTMPTAEAVRAARQPSFRYWLYCTWQNKLGADVVTVQPKP